MNMNSLLESLYKNDVETSRIEKTAESKMLDDLRHGGNVDNPYTQLSTEELIKMAQELEGSDEDEYQEEEYQEDGDQEKVAFEMLGGQVMAHAMVHEFDLMKVAMAHGLCRVCKENEMNVDESSICSACLED
jgi:hypothetical protein